MSTSKKIPETNRHHGGPGSSHQDHSEPYEAGRRAPAPGEPTNTNRSRVSGGGGERDRNHSRDPALKS